MMLRASSGIPIPVSEATTASDASAFPTPPLQMLTFWLFSLKYILVEMLQKPFPLGPAQPLRIPAIEFQLFDLFLLKQDGTLVLQVGVQVVVDSPTFL